MAKYMADLHPHSHYARACSPQLTIANNVQWAKYKGLQVIGTADFTHPLWLQELKDELVEVGPGIFRYKEMARDEDPLFVLTVETSHVYTQNERGRRIHVMTWAPSFEVVDKINAELTRRGAKLISDGRPMTGLTLIELAEAVLSVDDSCLVIPAHAWTPWYGIFGDKGGFDSLAEAFGDYANQIYAVETGLSSDPAMNWRIAELKNRQIVSFSDAHSPWKLGREATVFEFEDLARDGFAAIREAIRGTSDKNKIFQTVEFYPEEGKYHYTGHRNCGIRQSPQETVEKGERCPVCGQQLTVGVMHRVEELAGFDEQAAEEKNRALSIQDPGSENPRSGILAPGSGESAADRAEPQGALVASTQDGVNIYQDPQGKRPPYMMLVPLTEILAEVEGKGVNTKTVMDVYHRLITQLGNEFNVLLRTDVSKIAAAAGEKVAEGVEKVRKGALVIEPGYDGVFGTVKIWGEADSPQPTGPQQESLF